MKRRILYVDVWPKMFVLHRLGLARAAQNVGYEIHVAAPDEPERRSITEAGFHFHAIPLDRRSINPWREFTCIAALTRLFRELRPDLIHAMRLKPIVYGGIAARVAAAPAIVYGTTGLGYAFSKDTIKTVPLRAVIKTGLRQALHHPNSRILVENPDDESTLVRAGLVRAGMVKVIKGVGIDLSQFPLLRQADGEPVVVLASRMLWDKGVGEFVAAAKRLRTEGVRARFVLVGDSDPGNRSAVPTSQLEEWKRNGIVEWWGWQKDMVAVFAQAHVVCLPSHYREGVPRILIEAAACGRPIVTTDAPGCREIVHHGHNGLLVPLKDSSTLTGALRNLLQSPPLRLRMGLNGRALVAGEFSQEYVNDATLKVYDELLTSSLS